MLKDSWNSSHVRCNRIGMMVCSRVAIRVVAVSSTSFWALMRLAKPPSVNSAVILRRMPSAKS
jgi:hypothetical protein